MSDDQLCLDDPTRLALGGEPTWEGSCPPLQGDKFILMLDDCGLNFVQYKLKTIYLSQCYTVTYSLIALVGESDIVANVHC